MGLLSWLFPNHEKEMLLRRIDRLLDPKWQ